MSRKKTPTFGEELIQSMQEALAYARGEKTGAKVTTFDKPAVAVKAIREKTGFSQDEFAGFLGISPSGLKKWERDARRPSGAALTLLRVMEAEPEAVTRALGAGKVGRRAQHREARAAAKR